MSENSLGCGCFIVIMLVNLTLGSISTSYILWVWLAKDIPWYGDLLIGLFGGELIIPAAIITWLLRIFGAV